MPTNTMANLISGECLPAPLSWGRRHRWTHAWVSFGCSWWSTLHSAVGGVGFESLPLPSCSSWMLTLQPWSGLFPSVLVSMVFRLLLVPWAACSWRQHPGILALFLADHRVWCRLLVSSLHSKTSLELCSPPVFPARAVRCFEGYGLPIDRGSLSSLGTLAQPGHAEQGPRHPLDPVPSPALLPSVSVMGHCRRRGSQVLLGQECHLHVYEQGGVAQVRTRQQSPEVWDILQPARTSKFP